MAGKKSTDDQEDDALLGLPDDDDDLTSDIRKQFEAVNGEDDEDDQDDGGFGAPLDDEVDKRSSSRVNEEDGNKRLADAQDRREAKKPADNTPPPKLDEDGNPIEETPPAPAPKAPEGQDTQEGGGDDKTAPAADTPADDATYRAAVDTLPPAVQTRIKAMEDGYQELMKPFAGKDAMLAERNTTPAKAVEWLVNVEDYARRDQSGYMAWFVKEMTGGDATKMESVLAEAAGKLGYSIAKAVPQADPDEDGDEDLFMSDREKQLKEENRALKAAAAAIQNPQPEFGPDSPAEKERANFIKAIGEVDATGKLVRPHFQQLQHRIVALLREQTAATGQPATVEDLKTIYDTAELADPATRDDARKRILAAQQPAPVPEVKATTTAAAVDKAKTASTTIIDGSGPGSDRRPDAGQEVGIEDFIRGMLNKGS